jgi:5-carboxymethyl-2-hydroxymuconate isomerase
VWGRDDGQGRTQEQKKDLSGKVVRTLKAMLPAVDTISMNIGDFEKATYCNTTLIQNGEE